eukprot:TRINITY_DN37346_c0_g1_i1.p1 TRINITY_DN37346_c0_g1~~TRINITY_DN37346_c0_g1_i1.p1  ORF type:complete len:460 (+),score=78.63 TRINITY_DN37346_c0_g1_i1:62-1441(+)
MSHGLHELEDIEKETNEAYKKILEPLDQWGLVKKRKRCKYPMVLVMGNYSSGKSSLINYILGMDEQDVGAAPTDSGFTLLLKTTEPKSEIKGSSILSEKSLGFEDLKAFGPALEARLKLVRCNSKSDLFPDGVILLDTPGLTDFTSSDDEIFNKQSMHSVITWFAERSDLILFLFDPEKPGGHEQQELLLSLLRNNLEGKLKFVFNKVDRLQSVQDFVMTFGTLCWNLSKYFPRKDPPMFYTVFTPGKQGHLSEVALKECEVRRADLLAQLQQVPIERADNIIKQAEDAAARVETASLVTNELLRRAGKQKTRSVALMTAVAVALSAALLQIHFITEVDSPFSQVFFYCCIMLVTLACLAAFTARSHLHAHYAKLLTNIDSCFYITHKPDGAAEEISHDLESRWLQVRETMSLSPANLSVFSSLKKTQQQQLSNLSELKKQLFILHEKADRYRNAIQKR